MATLFNPRHLLSKTTVVLAAAIADIAGIEIAYKAYVASRNGEPAPSSMA